jgi:hypothetical protein
MRFDAVSLRGWLTNSPIIEKLPENNRLTLP